MGFCVSRMLANFVSLSDMTARALSPLGLVDPTDEEQLAANYGRAALHALVGLSPKEGNWPMGGINQEHSTLPFFRRLNYPWN